MALDVEGLAKQMAGAAAAVIGGNWGKVKVYALPEFTKIATTMANIEANKAAGALTEQEADILLDMQKNASRAVLLAAQSMTIVIAEQAINSALAVVRDFVNKAIGWPIV